MYWNDSFNLAAFDIGEIEEGDFFIRFKLRDKEDFKFNLVSVYGSAQNDTKDKFLSELVRMCSKETLPIVRGGDFNIIGGPDEKNNSNYNDKWPFLFNAIIDTIYERFRCLAGKYTWANHLQNQNFEKLDRILTCTDFESKFPRTTVQTLSRDISDHTPLFINTNNSSLTYQPQFKFELGW